MGKESKERERREELGSRNVEVEIWFADGSTLHFENVMVWREVGASLALSIDKSILRVIPLFNVNSYEVRAKMSLVETE